MIDPKLQEGLARPSVGWSDFARARHKAGTGYAFFTGYSHDDVVNLVRDSWLTVTPGDGEADLTRKVVVQLPPANFYCTSAPLASGMAFENHVYAHKNELALKTVARTAAVPAKFVKVVCFSAQVVADTFGRRSTDCNWEIVVIQAAEVEAEPMHFLSMARNMLEAPAGNPPLYSALQFAQSIHYWSQRVQVAGE